MPRQRLAVEILLQSTVQGAAQILGLSLVNDLDKPRVTKVLLGANAA